MQLISDWKKAWRFWSVQLAAVGALLTTALIALPDVAIGAWAVLPAEMKAAIPSEYMPLLGVAVFVLSMVARVIKQPE